MVPTSPIRSHAAPSPRAGLAALILTAALFWPGALNATLPTGFQDQVITGGFDRCTSFDFLPDGRILVVEQRTGNVRLVVNDTTVTSPIYTFTDVNANGNERGLLGVAVDSEFPARPYAYFHYTHAPEESIFVARLTATGDLSDGSSDNLLLQDPFLILDDLPDTKSNHNGGTVRFGPDGMLLISVGDDGTTAGGCAAQDSSQYHGKIFRIDVSGIDDMTPEPPPKSLITPPDNPFPATDPIAGIVFCQGLRNPFRFTIDPLTGRLYIGDVGNQDYEEVDEALGGENFGWPFREGPLVQNFPLPCSEPGGIGTQSYDDPIAYYSHLGLGSLSVIAGPCYRPVPGAANNFPALYDGAVFYGDFYQGFVRVVKKQLGSWAPLDSVPGQPNAEDWATGLIFPSQFKVGPDGSIYYTSLLVPGVGGELHRIVYTGPPVTGVPDDGALVGVLRATPNPLRSGRRLTLSLPEGDPTNQVTILGVDGRRVRSFSRVSGTSLTWDGRDEMGRPVSAGVYFVRAKGSQGTAAARIVVIP